MSPADVLRTPMAEIIGTNDVWNDVNSITPATIKLGYSIITTHICQNLRQINDEIYIEAKTDALY